MVLLSQVLALFLVFADNFFVYFFELFIAFAMVFFLSQGVRHKKSSHLTIYMAYLAIYVFMMIFIVFAILIDLSFLPSYRRHCGNQFRSSTTSRPFSTTAVAASLKPSSRIARSPQLLDQSSDNSNDCAAINGAFWADVWCAVTLSLVSIVVACVQIRYTLLLYRYLRTRQREQRSTMNVSYQHFVPGAPPRYTPESPHTIQTSPAQVEAGPLPAKTAQPEVTTLQAETLVPPQNVQPDKPRLPPAFLQVEGPPEYTETPGPSEIVCLSPSATEVLDEVDLNECRSPSRVDLLK